MLGHGGHESLSKKRSGESYIRLYQYTNINFYWQEQTSNRTRQGAFEISKR